MRTTTTMKCLECGARFFSSKAGIDHLFETSHAMKRIRKSELIMTRANTFRLTAVAR